MSSVNYTDAEILQFMLENANMDVDTIKHEMQMKEREKYLNMHPYKIWKGANGNYYTYFPSDENSEDRIRKQRANRKDLEDLIVKFWKDKEETITVEDVFTEWNERRARLGQIQLATHDRNIRVFNRHFSDFGQRDIKKITPLDINDFLEEELADKHLRAKAFSNLRAVVKGIFLRAKRRGLIDFSINQVLMDLDISDSSFNQEREDDEDQIFNEKQLAVLASYLKEHPDIWNLGIMLILVTGVRVGELVALKLV